nr:M23 family metallopeptidase [Methylobacterium sp.]
MRLPDRSIVRIFPSLAGRNRVVAGLLAATTLWGGATTWYLVFHDEVLARFVSQQSAMQYAYEERIGALRLQLERAAVERIAAREATDTRLAELAQRQAAMEKRQAMLAALAGESSPHNAKVADEVPPAEISGRRPLVSGKPVPSPDSLELRMNDEGSPESADRRSDREIPQTLSNLENRLASLAEAQARSLDAIALRAGRSARRLRGLVARLGLDASRLERAPASGLGGPLVPISTDPFGIALAEAQRSVGEDERLRRVTAALPLRQPLSGASIQSSNFGPRLDPFTRSLAMHTGIDMKAESGEPARATASGRVTVAEYSGGYGNMVEIDHGNGLATRYAHLSVLSVVAGQWVAAGNTIGRVGSTGRSTGSHLHYETRIDGEPVDPQRFLRAAASLDAWPEAIR